MRIEFGGNDGADPKRRTNPRAGKPDILLHSDADILVIVKPAGISTTPARNDARDVLSCLLIAHPEFSIPHPKPVHRLDRPVGGILLLSRSKRAEQFFSPDGVKRYMEKRYTAVVRGKVDKDHGTMRDYLAQDGGANLSRVVPEGTAGALESLLYYETKEEIKLPDGSDGTVLIVRLLTGRRHQIRAQLANAGCPIYGDARYGSEPDKGFTATALFAHELVITHPATRNEMIFQADPILYEPDAFRMIRREEKEVTQ